MGKLSYRNTKNKLWFNYSVGDDRVDLSQIREMLQFYNFATGDDVDIQWFDKLSNKACIVCHGITLDQRVGANDEIDLTIDFIEKTMTLHFTPNRKIMRKMLCYIPS